MSFEPAESFSIDDEETFDVLVDPVRIEILELCARPRSVGEVAEKMNVPRTRLYHHFNLMEEKGILAVAHTRQKGAMTEKVYQAAAKTYQPSERFLHDATPRKRAEAIINSLFSATLADFLRAVEDKQFALRDETDKRKVALGRRLLHLSPARLTEFIADLEDLFEQFGIPDDDPDAITVAALHIVHPSSREMP